MASTSTDPPSEDEVKLQRQRFVKKKFDARDNGLVVTQGIDRIYAPLSCERMHGRQLARKKQGASIGQKSLDPVWEILPANTRIVKQTPDTMTLRIEKSKPFLIRD